MAASIAPRRSRYPARGSVCGIRWAGGLRDIALYIAREMAAVVFERAAEPLRDSYARVPAGQRPEPAVVDQIISDIDALPFRRKLGEFVLPLPLASITAWARAARLTGSSPPTLNANPSALGREPSVQEGIGRVTDVQQVTTLLAVPDLDGLAFDGPARPDAQKGLEVLDPYPGPIDVSEPQKSDLDAVDVAIEQVVRLAGHFVEPVDVDGLQRMTFVDREVFGAAVDLPRPGMHDGSPTGTPPRAAILRAVVFRHRCSAYPPRISAILARLRPYSGIMLSTSRIPSVQPYGGPSDRLSPGGSRRPAIPRWLLRWLLGGTATEQRGRVFYRC